MKGDRKMLFKRIQYGDYLDEWLKEKKKVVKDSTYGTYSNHVENHIRPKLGKIMIHKIDQDCLQLFVGELFENSLSRKTILDIVTIIKTSLKDAHKKGYIKQLDHLSIQFPKQERMKKISVFSAQEQKKLLDLWSKEQSTYLLGIIVCMNTGMRIGELCALKWKDIDLDQKTIYVHSTLQRVYIKEKDKTESKVIIGSTKSFASERVIPINTLIFNLLKMNQKEDDDYLVTGNLDYIEPRKYRTIYSNILKKLMIEHRKFHSLRHTFATNCLELGIDYKTVSELLGHSSMSTTMNIYFHSKMKTKRDGLEKLSEFFMH